MMFVTRIPRAHRRRLALIALFVLVVGVLLSSSARAQSARAASAPITYLYFRGNDTIAVETLTPGTDVVRGVLAYRGQPRVEWEQSRAPLRLTLTIFAAGAPADAAPLQVASFVTQGDSIAAELGARGAMRPQMFASKSGARSIINNSVLQSALVASLARAENRSTLPIFLTAGARTLDATIVTTGDTTTMTIGGMPMRIIWQNDLPFELSIPAQGLRVVRANSATTLAPRPPVSYDAPADAPYTAEHVSIYTPRGYTLAGTLTRPRSARGPLPVVVMISGSGPQDRDSRISLVKDYAPFRDIADTLSRRGIAVLRYDDRGVGESGGTGATRDTATTEDFADDVLSVVNYLRLRRDIDGNRIALAGHSEGGLIAPIAATKDPRIAAIALLAGPAYNGRRVLEFQNEVVIRRAPGLTTAQRDSARRAVPATLDSIQQANRWMRYFMTTDPLAVAARVRQPVLILQGDTDQQVTPEQADTLASTLRRAGNRQVTMQRFPATNHLFLRDPSGAYDGYATLADTRVPRDVLGVLAEWSVRVLRP